MKLLVTLLMISWLVHNEVDLENRTFIREVQSVFSASPDKMIRMEAGDCQSGELQGQFFRIQGAVKSGYAWVGRVNSCRSGGCSGNQQTAVPADPAGEYFDYFILFDASANVASVRVFNYQATHGHGIMSRGWLRQFNGYSGEKKLEPGKNVDGISGATISVRALAADIEHKTMLLRGLVAVR
jgi:hypothetical protein